MGIALIVFGALLLYCGASLFTLRGNTNVAVAPRKALIKPVLFYGGAVTVLVGVFMHLFQEIRIDVMPVETISILKLLGSLTLFGLGIFKLYELGNNPSVMTEDQAKEMFWTDDNISILYSILFIAGMFMSLAVLGMMGNSLEQRIEQTIDKALESTKSLLK